MTTRVLAEVALRLLGVYYAVLAVLQAASVISLFAVPGMEGFPNRRDIAISSLAIAAARGFAAFVLLDRSAALARSMAGEHRIDIGPLSRRDLVTVGVMLVGVSLAASAVPGLLTFVATIVWYAEGSRQPMLSPYLDRSWETLARGIAALLVGGIMAAAAGRLASLIDRSLPHTS